MRPPSYGGVGWILAVDWWPYQQADFVTPPFAGYTSGHSGFSRAAAEVLTLISGQSVVPGWSGRFTPSPPTARATTLQFEYGPSEPVELQWVSYYDAADEAGQSRVWGGIHPPFDDYTGRLLGAEVGTVASGQGIGTVLDRRPPTGSPFAVPLTQAPWRILLVLMVLIGGTGVFPAA